MAHTEALAPPVAAETAVDSYPDTNSEHVFVSVKGLSGCARCGYARGCHPTKAMMKRERAQFGWHHNERL